MGYMIGVDGGATGTVGILADEDGAVIASAQGPASNYLTVGRENAQAALRQVVTEVVQRTGKSFSDCHVAAFGIAGLNNEADAEVYRALIKTIGLAGETVVENDVVIAWAAATGCQPGAVIIAGTGASAFGVNAAGKRHKTLGWDYRLADQGSGYWIGSQGLKAAFKVWDGRIDSSTLLQAMIDHYQLKSVEEMLTLAYNERFGKTEIAGFARSVANCAQAGDSVAQDILQQAGEELGQSVCAVIRRLEMADTAFVVGLVGGTFRAGPHLLDPFAHQVYTLAPRATIQPVRYPPVVGAIILAHYSHGALNATVLDQLQKTGNDVIRWKTS